MELSNIYISSYSGTWITRGYDCSIFRPCTQLSERKLIRIEFLTWIDKALFYPADISFPVPHVPDCQIAFLTFTSAANVSQVDLALVLV